MGYPLGFDPFGSLLKSGIRIELVQQKLTPMIEKLSGAVSNTMDEALQNRWGDLNDVHEIQLHDCSGDGRESDRESLCRC